MGLVHSHTTCHGVERRQLQYAPWNTSGDRLCFTMRHWLSLQGRIAARRTKPNPGEPSRLSCVHSKENATARVTECRESITEGIVRFSLWEERQNNAGLNGARGKMSESLRVDAQMALRF